MAAETAPTPYDLIGGELPVRQLVERFYDLMDEDPAVARLRAMHGADLGPMREKLGDFMVGWLGGPPLYFQRADARCMGSAHSPYAIDAGIRDQWLACMNRAMADVGFAPEVQAMVRQALERMTEAMRNR
jgi:hemoglobin